MGCGVQVESGHTVLVHAAAGGVGSLLCQWASALGATVIGTVSTEEKAAQATQDGCHHVIMYTKEDVVTRVREITSGKGVNVVYDSVGKDTYKVRLQISLIDRLCASCIIVQFVPLKLGSMTNDQRRLPSSAWRPAASSCPLGSLPAYLTRFR